MRKSLIPQTPVIKKHPDESQATKAAQNKFPSSQSPTGKRKHFKADLKLDYMQNQIDQIKNFKDFLQHINYSSKDLIKPEKDKASLNLNDRGINKRRNSFSLNDQMFRSHLPEQQRQGSKFQEKSDSSVSSSQGQQTNGTKDPQNIQKPEYKKIDLSKLCEITKLMQQKKQLTNMQIKKLKSKILHSSMWEDKQFYDFTQCNYGIKMTEVEERLQESEKNLQQKQKLKKQWPQNISKTNPNQVCLIRYGLYESDTKQAASVTQYIEARTKILDELKHINQIYAKFQALINNESFKVEPEKNQGKNLSESSQSSSEDQKIHPLISSTNLLKSQFQKFAEIIKAYRVHSKKRQSKDKHEPSDITKLLYRKVRTLNKQILQQQLASTKDKISKLKHSTQTIQNGINELQAFKALNMLRNKSYQQKLNQQKKEKSLKQTNKNAFDDEVLRVILQHQFFVKNRALRIQTKFSSLQKRKVRSKSENLIRRLQKHFRNIKIQRKCQSVKLIFCRQFLGQNQVKQKIDQAVKPQKRNGLHVVSGSSTKKQTGSSAQTNP